MRALRLDSSKEQLPNGPLASFDAADTWAPHPYREGVALIGDAAASNDPSFGEGLSLTVRDVRVLRDHLLGEADWDRAAHAYASEHDRHYAVIHSVTRWHTQMFLEQGEEADAAATGAAAYRPGSVAAPGPSGERSGPALRCGHAATILRRELNHLLPPPFDATMLK